MQSNQFRVRTQILNQPKKYFALLQNIEYLLINDLLIDLNRIRIKPTNRFIMSSNLQMYQIDLNYKL